MSPRARLTPTRICRVATNSTEAQSQASISLHNLSELFETSSTSPFNSVSLFRLRRRPKPPAARVRGGQDDGGGVPGGAAVSLLCRAGAARCRSGRVDGGGEQGFREGARADRQGRAEPVGTGRRHAAQEDGHGRGEPLQGPRERCRLHRGRSGAVPSLQQLVLRVRVHPAGLGRQRRRVQARLLPQTWARPRPGAEERRPMDGGGAQVILDGAEEVREGGLEEHLASLCDEPDADAGGQSRAEVLHPPQLRRQGQAPLQHSRHHHGQPARGRRQQLLAVVAVRAHHCLGPVRRPRRRETPSPAVARHATALDVTAAAGSPQCQPEPPLRQREARAQGLVLGRRHGTRSGRRHPSADAMRAVVSCDGGSRRREPPKEEETRT